MDKINTFFSLGGLKLNKISELKEIPLSSDSIEVYVNDIMWEMDKDWIYNSEHNYIELLEIPESNAPVVIAYLI